MDITFDGHWVLTTSDFFLTVAPTQFKVWPLDLPAQGPVRVWRSAGLADMLSLHGCIVWSASLISPLRPNLQLRRPVTVDLEGPDPTHRDCACLQTACVPEPLNLNP